MRMTRDCSRGFGHTPSLSRPEAPISSGEKNPNHRGTETQRRQKAEKRQWSSPLLWSYMSLCASVVSLLLRQWLNVNSLVLISTHTTSSYADCTSLPFFSTYATSASLSSLLGSRDSATRYRSLIRSA